jgi:hypothetical protein
MRAAESVRLRSTPRKLDVCFHAGIDHDTGGILAALAAVRVEGGPPAVAILVRPAVHVVGYPPLLHADGAMLLQLIAPAVREVFGMAC